MQLYMLSSFGLLFVSVFSTFLAVHIFLPHENYERCVKYDITAIPCGEELWQSVSEDSSFWSSYVRYPKSG